MKIEIDNSFNICDINTETLHKRFLESGSEESLWLLMQMYYKPLCGYVYSILGNHEDADEITNDTFLKIFNKRKTIQKPDKLDNWLYTTAKNAAFDRLRSRQSENSQMQEYINTISYGGQAVADVLMLTEKQKQQTLKYKYILKGLM